MIVRRKPRSLANGTIYCSPACGFNCTRKAFDDATISARLLCETMGKGWKPRVWENCGWHYEVSNGNVHIHADIRQMGNGVQKLAGYSCFFNTAIQAVTHSRSPKMALRKAVDQIAEWTDQMITDRERILPTLKR